MCWYTRNGGKLRGRYRMMKWLIERPLIFENSDKRVVQLKHVGPIELNPSDYIEKILFITGEYENNLVELLNKVLKKGDCFLDIGANIGYFSLIAANIVQNEGVVYSFEASDKTFQKLERNIELNRINNLKLFNFAVSNKEESLTFNIQKDGNSGMSSFRKLDGYKAESITINAKPIDYFLNEMSKIKLIKMDIEGAEGMVIEGMQNLINRDRPFITLELVDKYLIQLGYSAQNIIEKLKQLNYQIYFLDFPLKMVSEAPKEQCNILCIPNEVVPDF